MSELSTHRDDPDVALIRAMAAGQPQALDQLYERRGPAIYGYLVMWLRDQQLAQEILQDVMLAAWNNAANFRGDSQVLTWLVTIARNRAINAQRKYAPTLVSIEQMFDLHNDDTGPLEKMERQTQRQAVKEAIMLLPENHREILVLTFYRQLSGAEIADVLDINIGTVKSRLHRAKEALRRVLINEERL